MRTAALFAVILSTSAPVAGNQAVPNPRNAAPLGGLRPAQPNDPYRQLFTAERDLMQQARHLLPHTPQPKVVCGMLVIPADPAIDPKMAVPPNKAPGVEFKMRTQEPPVCSPAK